MSSPSRAPHMLLISLGAGAVPGFLSRFLGADSGGTVIGYLDDAAAPVRRAPFTAEERSNLELFGYRLTPITAGAMSRAEFIEAVDGLDAVYVAGGSTFSLLAGLRRNGADDVLRDRINGGLPYIGCSAGAVVVGPSIEPISLMDSLPESDEPRDLRALGIIDSVVIPHADGALTDYPSRLIDETVHRYGERFRLTLLRDDQALLIDGDTARVVSSP